jgi:hypothetical protein
MGMQVMSSIRREFVASHLRSQLDRLHHVLGNIEEANKVDCDYTHSTLKEIENNLRQIRKLCVNN